jgi:hypothetical protein
MLAGFAPQRPPERPGRRRLLGVLSLSQMKATLRARLAARSTGCCSQPLFPSRSRLHADDLSDALAHDQ